MENRSTYLRTFERLLLTLVLMELFLGGGGRLTEIGALTLRMYLFALCMAWVTLRLAWGSTEIVPLQVWRLLSLFLGAACIATLIGLVRGAGVEAIAGDLKPLMYFPMILFFAMAIRGRDDVALVSLLVVVCGIVQTFAYFAVLAAAHSGAVSYPAIYFPLNDTGEFFFRGADQFFLGFFYKGFLYMCVAFIFLLIDPVRRNRWLALMVFAAVVLTFTRGFLASLMLTFVFGALLVVRNRGVALLLLLVLGAAVGSATLSADLIESFQKAGSDEVRVADLRTVWAEFDVPTLLFGKGFGALIGERERIEMTYIEVVYKQGIIGLVFWATLLYANFVAFVRVPDALRRQALVFHLAVVFVYIQTATNPFLNNPIGMSMVLISTVVLLALARSGRSPSASRDGVVATAQPGVYS